MVKCSWKRLLSRRQVLLLSISSVTTLAVLLFTKTKALSYLLYTLKSSRPRKSVEDRLRKFTIVGTKSLKERAAAKGIIYGAFPQAYYQYFSKDRQLQASMIRDCAMMTVGYYWVSIRPSIDTFDFRETDGFVKFATSNRMLLRGHPLLWHETLPQWCWQKLNQNNAEQILTKHIDTVVRRYAGKMHSWDVVNEAIDVGHKRSDGMRNTPWLKFLGIDYVDFAFRLAAKADPNAKLVYNDFGIEYDTYGDEAKREAVLNFLQRLKSKGTPIYALGIQAHLVPGTDRFDPGKFSEFLKNVASLGLKIMITEMDVSDKKLPVDIARRDRVVAGVYEDFLSVALAEKAVVSVTTWGLSDRYSWLSEYRPRPDRLPMRPLPLDVNFKPKLAWNAIARAFDRASQR